MARLIRVKNTNSTDTWEGQTISPGQYYTLDETEHQRWAESSKVYDSVADGTLVVNNGSDNVDDFTDPKAGWKWLTSDTTPQQTSDGDWHFVNENFAHVSGNHGINWTVECELENDESYQEKFVLPAGRHATLNILRGGSDKVPSSILLEWYEELTVDEYMRVNPWVRADEQISGVINGAHTTGDTVITIYNTNNEIDWIMADHYYCFAHGSGGFHAKVLSVDIPNAQFTLAAGIPEDLANGDKIALTDRPIGRIGNQIAADSLAWASPPNGFIGNDKNYFLLTIKNEDDEDVGLVSATLNGWHTSNTGGD